MKISKEKIILTVAITAPIIVIAALVCGSYFIWDHIKSSQGKQIFTANFYY